MPNPIILIFSLLILIMIFIIIIWKLSRKRENNIFFSKLKSGDLSNDEIIENINGINQFISIDSDEAHRIINKTVYSDKEDNFFKVEHFQKMNENKLFLYVKFINKKSFVLGGFAFDDCGKFIFKYLPEEKKALITSDINYETLSDKIAAKEIVSKFSEFITKG